MHNSKSMLTLDLKGRNIQHQREGMPSRLWIEWIKISAWRRQFTPTFNRLMNYHVTIWASRLYRSMRCANERGGWWREWVAWQRHDPRRGGWCYRWRKSCSAKCSSLEHLHVTHLNDGRRRYLRQWVLPVLYYYSPGIIASAYVLGINTVTDNCAGGGSI